MAASLAAPDPDVQIFRIRFLTGEFRSRWLEDATRDSPVEKLIDDRDHGGLRFDSKQFGLAKGGISIVHPSATSLSGAFDRSQLRRRQREPIELPADFRLQHRRQLAAVDGS
jgi:hypothetical protein